MFRFTSRTPTVLSLALLFVLVYFSILSKTGIIERRNLENRIKALRIEVDRLENENDKLKIRQEVLKNDEKALAMEASKYYLLTENARVIKFKEPVEVENGEKVLVASQLPQFSGISSSFRPMKLPPLGLVKFLYVITTTFIGMGIFMKLRRS
ncbi:MAG: septum formation initiator family protein [Leptospiraceae bacterium]|nr:septum formation initiator family protein [Leptospiraceae bacterium]MCP5501652.1 septum formation initiator family protein [Leptospiraceae bacterium]